MCSPAIAGGILQSAGLGLLLVAPFVEEVGPEEEAEENLGIYPVVSATDLGVTMSFIF